MYKVRFVNPQKHYKLIKKDIDAAMKDVLSRGDLIMRKDLEIFEKRFARYIGTKYAIGVNSGFDALHLSLYAIGIKKGDEVITVSHTFVATIAAIVHQGAHPVLIDVDKDFNMNTSHLQRALTKKTRAIIPVHLNGRVCNMDEIMTLAKQHRIPVVEDAAQSIGAQFKKRKAGSFGITGCFSLYPFKMLGCAGDGGIITTSDKTTAQTLRYLRDHGQNRATGDIVQYGFNSRLDNIQAALLNIKLSYLPAWIKRRREIAQLYYKGLKNIPELILPHFQNSNHYDVFQNYVVRGKNRDKLKKFLYKQDIETLVSWPKPTHAHKALKLNFSLPETEKLCADVLSLPMFPELTNTEVHYVIKSIQKFYA